MGYHSDEKAGSPNAHNNIDESQKQRLHEKKKTDTKEYILYIILLNSRNGNEPLVTESRSEVAWFQG